MKSNVEYVVLLCINNFANVVNSGKRLLQFHRIYRCVIPLVGYIMWKTIDVVEYFITVTEKLIHDVLHHVKIFNLKPIVNFF